MDPVHRIALFFVGRPRFARNEVCTTPSYVTHSSCELPRYDEGSSTTAGEEQDAL
jgi:hypothetical protein